MWRLVVSKPTKIGWEFINPDFMVDFQTYSDACDYLKELVEAHNLDPYLFKIIKVGFLVPSEMKGKSNGED